MARVLYRSTFLESWGTGIQRIIKACREQCVEEPTWRCDGAFVYVTFKRPIKEQSLSENLSQEKYRNDVAPSNSQVSLALDDKILQLIKANPIIKREDMSSLLSVNKKTIERHLKRLGVKWEGHSKTGRWIIP